MWGGREGIEADAAKDVRWRSIATPRPSTSAARTSATGPATCAFALEPKPNEPRGDILLPTVGHALAFISALE